MIWHLHCRFMAGIRRAGRSRSVIWLVGTLLVAACGGGGGSSGGGGTSGGGASSGEAAPPAVVLTDMQPLEHGFAFANFPASWYEDEFVADDLVAMFGNDPSVCVDGVADPCELTAEAAAFARMVNQSRASGHCEGLVAVAQVRFNEQSDPPTANLLDDTETIKAIMRAFATQFIPEVRDEITTWLGSSLADKIKALETSLAEGKLTYSLGVYIEDGGHAILPYAIEYLTPTKPRIMIYDSNWPGRNRWVDVDLETETWTFSFAGDDPDNDPDLWSGGANRMDLTSLDSRAGSCPFCEGEVGVAKNALLVRSTDLEWSVESGGETVGAQDAGAESTGVVVTPVKGQAGSGRTSYDYFIEIPEGADGERAKLNLPGTSSVFALTPSGIAQISTPGNPDIPIEVGATSFVSADPAVTLSLASGNLVATASGPTASLEITDEGLKAAVTTEDGQTVEVAVTPETPAAKIVADPEQGGIEVLAQAADGIVEKRDIAADGSETVTIETTPLNLNATTWEAPPGLESAPLPMLPPPDARNVNNPDYAVDTPYTPPADAVPASDTVPPTTEAPTTTTTAVPTTTVATTTTTTLPPTTTTTTTPPTTTTTVPRTTTTTAPSTTTTTTTTTTVPRTTTTTTTVPRTTTTTVPRTTTTTTTITTTTTTTTTTTVPPTTTPPPPPTTTVPPLVQPALALPPLGNATYGDAPLLVVVLSNSPASITFASSNESVATVTSASTNSAYVTIVGAGTTSLSVSQPATGGFAAGSASVSFTVDKATQPSLTVTSLIGTPGSTLALTTSGGSGAGGVTFALTNNGGGACTLAGSNLSRSSVGTCVVTATRAGDDNHQPTDSAPTTITFANVLHGTIDEGSTLTMVAPPGTRFSNVLFASYGTPQGSAGNFTIGSCHAANSTTIVSNSAIGRTEAVLPATNQVYGDPCSGTFKRLSVSLEFEIVPTVPGTLTVPSLADAAYGDPPIALTVVTNSPAPVTFTSSNTAVATIASQGDTAQITIVGVGATTITISQEAITGFTSTSATRTLTVNKGSQAPLTISSITGVIDTPLALTTSGGSGTGAVTFTLEGSSSAGCTLSVAQLSRSTAGTCGVVATKAETNLYLATSSAVTTVTFADPDIPGAVTNLSATLVADTAQLSWTSATTTNVPLDGHRVRYRRSDATNDWVTLATLAPASTSAELTGLVSGYRYDIEVAGLNARGVGAAGTTSVTLSGSTTPTEIVPTACALIVGSSPGGEECEKALLNPGRTDTNKYLNFSETTNQVWVDLGAAYHLTQLQVYTANAPGRAPVAFQIYAANGSSSSLGTGPLVASGTQTCPDANYAACTVNHLTPTVALRYIVIQFPQVRSPGNYMEVSRILLHGLRAQAALTVTSTNGEAGVPLTLAASGGSGTGSVTYALIGSSNAGCTLAGGQLERTTAGTCTVVATRAADATFAAVCSAPTTVTFEAPPPGVLLYQVTNPKRVAGAIQYTPGYGLGATDSAATVDANGGVITRIYYRMEVRDHQGIMRYVEVGFDPWTTVTAGALRVPDRTEGNQFVVQEVVQNLSVTSNVTNGASPRSLGVTNATGRTGYLEIWPWSYFPQKQFSHAWGTTNLYDSHDIHYGDGTYGSFQVHDVTNPSSPSTLLSWNRHNHEWSVDIGIGNAVSGQPDWTTATENGGLGIQDWKLQIRADIATTISATACAANDAFSPGNQRCDDAFVAGVDNLETKFYTWDRAANQDVWLDLGTSHQLTEFEIWTAEDVEGRDPTSIQIFASDASKTVGTQLASLTASCPSTRRAVCTPMTFAATPANRHIVVRFAATKSGGELQMSRAFFRGFAAPPA